ncbi:Fis transcriptional activator [Legionella geestiana]|uniref:Putative Fis-like DNA-binding protein n=1 Tax=Legionella geestiana TaxID=45065 RepID=A0A0W0TVL4_9GAMM|nr:helix-turn-helix domain-containing protein [Legionella geestiana]KTC99735.1 Fis transcriptional activator [Legionella geestiana]QBS13143.1 Fis family transcriptional regulator [Legionella geestiana]QDQ39174.1 Fis family transcriptional regulator [Legionella geestiana]STX54339.1 Fis transcriptional activator [Legionella geestiana]
MSAVLQEVEQRGEALTHQVVSAVRRYLTSQNSKDASLNLYQLIVEEVEAPLFRTVMELTRYNQSKAARVLGVSRGTLRTKLKRYFDDEFIGTRDV